MKVSVIGGGGRVGSNALFAMQLGGVVKELAVIDVNRDMAEGEALDLRHGSAFCAPQRIYSGGTELAEGSDIVVITAGLRRKPDESRLQLINRNVSLFNGILDELSRVSLPESAVILVVSNPVDILTHLAVRRCGLPAGQVIGLGTVLDTLRFRSLLAQEFNVAATDVNALILGEHGDSMVPIWSSATVNGIALSSLPGYTEDKALAIFDFTRRSGAEVIRLKGGAGYAVGVAIAEVVHAVARDAGAMLPVSSLQTGMFGMQNVCLSVPTIVGRRGVQALVEPALSQSERTALIRSAGVLVETMAQIES